MRASSLSTFGIIIGAVSLILSVCQIIDKASDSVLIRAAIVGQLIILLILLALFIKHNSRKPGK
jgi:hypothetical protein